MQISKADRIRSLLKQGYSTKIIADIVGCQDAYVRAVRQRTDEDGNCKTDNACIAWQQAHPEKLKEYRERRRQDPERWGRYLARQRERYHTDPEYRARALAASKRWQRQNRHQSVSA